MAVVRLTPEAARQLDSVNEPIHTRILRLIERLEDWPAVSGAKALRGELAGRWRLRTGDYRLQFRVSGDTVIVDRIGHVGTSTKSESMPQTVTLEGTEYVIVPRDEYERLSRAARMPPLPEPGPDGNYPAIEYARASLARKLIMRREAIGLSQAGLARAAGVRVETLCRIESGKVTPTLASVEKLNRAMSKLESGTATRSVDGRNRKRAR